MTRLLVVAGEGSGDALAGPVLSLVRTEAFGLGGPHCSDAGLELVADARSTAAMGFGDVLGRAPAFVRAMAGIVRETRRRRPRAALLVGFSEPNARLAPWLRRHGIRVLWYAPPQTWAWRPGRSLGIATSCEQLAVLLPFEAPLWRSFGARVEYVGHPAVDSEPCPSTAPAPGQPIRVAVLPGSRAHEVRRHLGTLLGGVRALAARRGPVEARVVCARGLDPASVAWLERTSRDAGAEVLRRPLRDSLPGHHVALCASGTATLECAALGIPPVIVHRTSALTFAIARHLVRVRQIGLPNLVLGREQFPELIQRSFTPDAVACAAEEVLRAHEAHLTGCQEVRERLDPGDRAESSAVKVAALLRPWID